MLPWCWEESSKPLSVGWIIEWLRFRRFKLEDCCFHPFLPTLGGARTACIICMGNNMHDHGCVLCLPGWRVVCYPKVFHYTSALGPLWTLEFLSTVGLGWQYSIRV